MTEDAYEKEKLTTIEKWAARFQADADGMEADSPIGRAIKNAHTEMADDLSKRAQEIREAIAKRKASVVWTPWSKGRKWGQK